MRMNECIYLYKTRNIFSVSILTYYTQEIRVGFLGWLVGWSRRMKKEKFSWE